MFPLPPVNTRIGFQYYQDSNHYRQVDVNIWLPFLKTLGASWITLTAPIQHAIPESFISAFKASGIEPILHFYDPRLHLVSKDDISLILKTYQKWGVNYVSFFAYPNLRRFWSTSEWARDSLVERFLDRFVPLARTAVSNGLFPVFSLLQPGGDYWDLVFFRSCLRGLVDRGLRDITESLVVSTSAAVYGKPLSWGKGGCKRWSGNRPYFTSPGSEDHIGFNGFEWYSEIVLEELGERHPMVLFNTGIPISFDKEKPEGDADLAKEFMVLSIMKALYSSAGDPGELVIPGEVIAGCFECRSLPVQIDFKDEVESFVGNKPNFLLHDIQSWVTAQKIKQSQSRLAHITGIPSLITQEDTFQEKSINHYLLIPLHPFGIADWDLDAVRPFILKNRPTVGFHLEEAVRARHVTILETKPFKTETWAEELKSAGCQVDTISLVGTNIAT